MKLKFTRKTWYFCLLVAAAATLLNGLAVLTGQDFSFLEMCAFCLTALSALFLAAEKGSDPSRKRSYFGVFLLLMVSYLFAGWLGYLCAALAWPLLLYTASRAGAPVSRQLRLVCGAEGLHLLFVLLAGYGGFESAQFWANLFWVLLAVARGWAALTLYRAQEET